MQVYRSLRRKGLDGHWTKHFEARSRRRGLPEDIVEFILDWGTEICVSGTTFLYVPLRSLPAAIRSSPRAARARGWLILESEAGTLLTCYRSWRPLAWVRKRRDYYWRVGVEPAPGAISRSSLHQAGERALGTTSQVLCHDRAPSPLQVPGMTFKTNRGAIHEHY